MGILGKGLGVKNSLDNLLKLMGDEIHPEPRLPCALDIPRPTTSVTSCGSGWWRSITRPGWSRILWGLWWVPMWAPTEP